VTATAVSGPAGSTTTSPAAIGTVPFTRASPKRCRVRKVTDERTGSSRYRPFAGVSMRSLRVLVVLAMVVDLARVGRQISPGDEISADRESQWSVTKFS